MPRMDGTGPNGLGAGTGGGFGRCGGAGRGYGRCCFSYPTAAANTASSDGTLLAQVALLREQTAAMADRLNALADRLAESQTETE